MFIADQAQDLSTGTLYAAQATPAGPVNGDRFNLQWIRLGHASDAQIKAMVDRGIRFSDRGTAGIAMKGRATLKRLPDLTGDDSGALRHHAALRQLAS